MTDPASPSQPAAPPKEQEGPTLLEQLEDLGGTLVQSEIPAGSRLQQIVGGIVKVLGHGGVTVADELFPKEEEPVSRPETAQAQHQAHVNTRMERIESALEGLTKLLEGKDDDAATTTTTTTATTTEPGTGSTDPNPDPSSTATEGQEPSS